MYSGSPHEVAPSYDLRPLPAVRGEQPPSATPAPQTEQTLHSASAGVTLLWQGVTEAALQPHAGSIAFLFTLPRSPATPGSMTARRIATAPKTGIPAHAAGSPIANVAVVIDPAARTGFLAADNLPSTRGICSLYICDHAAKIALPLSPDAQLAAESIQRCPFAGVCRTLVLTARAHDLVLAFLSALPDTPCPRHPALLRCCVDRLHDAAKLLDRMQEEPPTLAELARQVGLGETALKRGFPRVFGTTVFGYLRERRLDRARQLLLSGEATVMEAAAAVGYSNPSNFASAFRARFGVNPKAFQLTARR